MKQDINIDQFFKDKLGEREFELKDSFIADLEQKLDQKKAVGFNWKLISLLSILLIGAVSIGYYSFTSNKNNTLHNSAELSAFTDSQEKTLTESNLKENKTAASQKNTLKNNKEFTDDKNVVNDVVAENQIRENTITGAEKNKLNDNKQSPIQKTVNITPTNNAKKKTNLKPVDYTSSAKDFNRKKASISDSNIVDNKKNVELKFAKENEELANKPSDYTPVTSGNEKQISGNLSNKQEPNETEKALNKPVDGFVENNEKNKGTAFSSVEKQEIEQQKTLKKEANNNTALTKGDNHNEIDSTIIDETDVVENAVKLDAPENVAKKKDVIAPKILADKKWTVSLFSGPAAISKTISGDASNTYFKKREDEEKNITSFNYGVEVGYFINKNLHISTGLNSLDYGEVVEYSEISSTEEVSVITSYNLIITVDSFTQQPDTTFIPVYTNQTVNDTSIASFTNKNKYTYIHIPFMIGYKVSFGKLSLNPKIGASYGRLVKSGGSYTNTALNAVETTDLEKNIFNVVASTAIGYKIKKVNYFIEPKYQFNVTDVFIDSEVKQAYKAFGVGFGISLEF